ncbi:MAG: hypothetical protein HY335_00045 [Deinococcus sp.]|nr:hypothetical protein [Deinococcus sp.]
MTKVSPTQAQRPLPPVYLPQDPYGDSDTERQQLPECFHSNGIQPPPDVQAAEARRARAEALVPFVEPLNGQGWAVPSCKDPGIRYLVSKANGHFACTCPDFDKHREEPGFSCKHIFAIQQWQAQRQSSPAVPQPAGELLPPEGQAVVAQEPVADVAEAYRQMDTLDEVAILQELEGGVVREYVYRFRLSSGQQVDGLSWPGQKAVARELQRRGLLGPIQMSLVQFTRRQLLRSQGPAQAPAHEGWEGD